jgi:hypothetical protein
LSKPADSDSARAGSAPLAAVTGGGGARARVGAPGGGGAKQEQAPASSFAQAALAYSSFGDNGDSDDDDASALCRGRCRVLLPWLALAASSTYRLSPMSASVSTKRRTRRPRASSSSSLLSIGPRQMTLAGPMRREKHGVKLALGSEIRGARESFIVVRNYPRRCRAPWLTPLRRSVLPEAVDVRSAAVQAGRTMRSAPPRQCTRRS